jgi:enoyl-CoA hydratase/carnithine racemase
MPYRYDLVSVEIDGGVAFATIDNPPINLMTLPLFMELARLGEELRTDDDVRAVVLKSANPDFFIAHFDVEAILDLPTNTPAVREEELNFFHRMCECFRTMPKATIVQIEGRVGGGGSELASSCDMRFGVRGKTVVNQMEVPLGIIPGGTGTQRLPRLLGRGRALQVILAGEDLDAETAERWGYLNLALEANEIGPYVERLARRIASCPAEAVAAAKASVLNTEGMSLGEGLSEEAYLFQTLIRNPSARESMRRFLKVGGQTREGELRVSELCEEVRKEG